MLDEFPSVRRREFLVDFLEEPIVIVDEALHRLHQLLSVASLLGGQAR